MMSLQPHNMRIEEAMPTDEATYYNPYSQQQQQQQPQYPMQPPPAPSLYNTQALPQEMDFTPTPQQPPQPPSSSSLDAEEEARLISERTEARDRAQAAQAAAKGMPGQPMRIRNDYVPRAQAKRQTPTMALCPNCKQQIPFDELEQHMKSVLSLPLASLLSLPPFNFP